MCLASALDIVSGGRLELGIGAGWNEEESGAYGIELGSIKERVDRFEEAGQVLVGLLAQETTTFNGRYFQLEDAHNEPKGPQQPHPPICIGGSGEKRTLRITARYADHWNFVGGPPEESARKRGVLPRTARTSAAIRPRSRCRRTCGWVRNVTTRRWSTKPPRWLPRGWTWRSSTCRSRMTRMCSSRWHSASAIPG